MNNIGVGLLCNAIIEQAAKDYRNALAKIRVDGKPSSWVIQDCENFFHSQWFSELTNVDGDYLIRKLREEFE